MILGACMLRDGMGEQSGPPQPAADAAAGGARQGEARTAPDLPPPPKPLPPSQPTRIKIPSIHVDAPLMNVGLDADGWIQAPPAVNRNLAAWYSNSVSPGAKGTSVIVGHVDNRAGPVVFYNLGALTKGRTIEVPRQDGRTAVFSVYGIEVFAKNDFPSERVYGDTGKPELRVLTCGGGFTKRTGYLGNVVVFARLVKTL
nr:class F sortase [Wenjunlia tyrosinilytica]